MQKYLHRLKKWSFCICSFGTVNKHILLSLSISVVQQMQCQCV